MSKFNVLAVPKEYYHTEGMQLKNCRKKKTQRTKETKEETTNNEQMHWYMVETPQLAQSDSLTSKAFTPL